MPQLVVPDVKYRESFIRALEEARALGEQVVADPGVLRVNFSYYVRRLQDAANPLNVKPGKVPETVLWLVEGEEYLGRLSIRHELNALLLEWGGHIGYSVRPGCRRRGFGKKLLALGLERCREMGLNRVLVTCNETNLGSKKIIEANGGVFENAVDILEDGRPVRKLRYWIDLN